MKLKLVIKNIKKFKIEIFFFLLISLMFALFQLTYINYFVEAFFTIIFSIIVYTLFFLYYKKHQSRLGLLIFFLTIFIFLASIASSVSHTTYFLPYNQEFFFAPIQKFSSIINGLRQSTNILLIFGIILPINNKKSYVSLLLWIVVIFGIFNIFYSIIAFGNDYLKVITNGFTFGSPRIQSFFGPNAFGYFLLLSFISSILLAEHNHNYYFLLFSIPFFVFSLFCYSKTNLALFALIVFLYSLYKILKYFYKNKLIFFSIIFAVSAISIAFLLMFIFGTNPIHHLFMKIFDDFGTLKSRILIWKNIILMFSVSDFSVLLFGFSNVAFSRCLNLTYTHDPDFDDLSNIASAHNGFLEAFGRGGLVLLIIDIILLVVIFKKILGKEAKLNNSIFFLLLIALFGIFFEHMFESIGLVLIGNSYMTTMYYFVLIAIANKNFMHNDCKFKD